MTFSALIARLACPARPAPFRWVWIAALCAASALALRLLLDPFLPRGLVWLAFWPAVLIATAIAGELAGLLALALSVGFAWGFLGAGAYGPASTLLFLAMGGLCVGIGGGLWRALCEVKALLADKERARDEVEAQEERLRLAQLVAGFGLFDIDLETGASFLTDGFLRNWGLPRESVTGRDVLLERVHPEDRDRVRASNDAAMASGKPYEIEYRIIRGDDNRVRWLQVRGEVILRPDGRPRRMLGVNQDITDRKLAEGALRESEARFREIADSAPAAIWVTDRDGAIQFGNRAMFSLVGGSGEGVLGLKWLETLHPEDRDRVLALRTAAVGSELKAYAFDARYRSASGEWRWISTQSQPRLTPEGNFLGYVGLGFDVTETRAAEAALRESESRFREVADGAATPVWVLGEEGQVEYANPAWRDFAGTDLSVGAADLLREHVHPDDVEHVQAVRGAAMAACGPYQYEARLQRHDGEWRWLRVSARPRLHSGAMRGYVGIGFDVTEVRRNEQRLKAMFDQASAGIARAGVDNRLDMVNDRFAQMLGRQPEQLIGLTVDEITWPEDRALNRDHMQRLQEGRPYTITMRYLHVDGSPVWANTSATPDRDESGQFRGSIAVVVDLTQARRAEAALQESEQRFRLIADSAPVLMWVSRLGGEREFVNRAYAEFAGLEYESALTMDWRDHLHRDDLQRILAEQRAGESSVSQFTLEARYRRHDGEWRWLRSFSQPRWGLDGEHAGFIGVAFDVTEARQASEDLIRINDLLEERVQAALEQKELAEAALLHAQKIEAVGRLTGGVAHDFNNLLTVVIGALDQIQKYPDDARKRARMAEAAMTAARRGERLTHQLLAFSRRQALRPEVCDPNRLLRESEPLLRRAVGEAVAFDFRLGGQSLVQVDAGQLEAALLNLVVNARDATPPGGSILVETRVEAVDDADVLECAPGRYVAISVRDSGQGMSPETAARAFEPFFTTKAVGKGTGLGLSQVYGFARQSGGVASIDSKPGLGTTVTVYLPVAQEAAVERSLRLQPAAPMHTRALKILLVEDDPAVATIAETMLTDLGHSVERAEAAEPALSALRSGRPYDLLLTDVIMPGAMNGVMLAHEAVTIRPGLEVLLTSGYAGDTIDDALAEAPWPFLRKPYAEAELAEVLQTFGRADTSVT